MVKQLTDVLGPHKSIRGSALGERRRHYCKKCKAKKEQRFMVCLGVSVNNRLVWQCVDCREEHRRYGKKW